MDWVVNRFAYLFTVGRLIAAIRVFCSGCEFHDSQGHDFERGEKIYEVVGEVELADAVDEVQVTDDPGISDLLDDNGKKDYGYGEPEQAKESAEEEVQQRWAPIPRALGGVPGQDGSGDQIGEGCGEEKDIGQVAERAEDDVENQVDLLDADAFLVENDVDETEGLGAVFVASKSVSVVDLGRRMEMSREVGCLQ